jgi:hypothetical protein
MLVSRWLAVDSFFDICTSRNMITESLLSNGRPLWLHYSGFLVVLTEPLLAMVIFITILSDATELLKLTHK